MTQTPETIVATKGTNKLVSVDRLSAIDEELEELAVKQKKLTTERDQIIGSLRTKAAKSQPAAQVSFEGRAGSVASFGVVPSKTELKNLKGVHEYLIEQGNGDSFYDIATMTLANLKAYVPEPARSKFISTKREGTRKYLGVTRSE